MLSQVAGTGTGTGTRPRGGGHRPSIRRTAGIPPSGGTGTGAGSGAGSGAGAGAGSRSAWREALRRGCLERARKGRRDAVLRSRGMPGTSTAAAAAAEAGHGSAGPIWPGTRTPETSAPPSRPQGTRDAAMSLVEEELRNKGVSVHGTASPSSACVAIDHEGYAISTDEVYDLMREVEEEIRREEARLVDELRSVERERVLEDERLREQVAYYEDMAAEASGGGDHAMNCGWEDSAAAPAVPSFAPAFAGQVPGQGTGGSTGGIGGDGTVLCPCCRDAGLVLTPSGAILCPGGTGGGRCRLRLDLGAEGMTLDNLNGLINSARREHAQSGCGEDLTFQVLNRFGGTSLGGGCARCGFSAYIA